MANSARTKRPIPLFEQFHGRSRRAQEARACLAEEAGVDEATVEGWVAGDELPPDEVIRSLMNDCSIAWLMNWENVPRSAIPEQWRSEVAADAAQRLDPMISKDGSRLLSLIERRLHVELDLSQESAGVPELRQLRMALQAFLATPLSDDETETA